MLWHQGESDAGQPVGAYKKNLTQLIAKVRKDLAQPKLPVLIGQLYDNGKREYIFLIKEHTLMPKARSSLGNGSPLKC